MRLDKVIKIGRTADNIRPKFAIHIKIEREFSDKSEEDHSNRSNLGGRSIKLNKRDWYNKKD